MFKLKEYTIEQHNEYRVFDMNTKYGNANSTSFALAFGMYKNLNDDLGTVKAYY